MTETLRNADTGESIPERLLHKARVVLEFHRWGHAAPGVTGGRTMYPASSLVSRQDTASLESLCGRIARHLAGNLSREAETLLLAGKMYRRSADYAKAGEYFLRALDLMTGAPAAKEHP